VGVLIFFIQPDYVGLLFSSLLGQVLVGIAIGLQLLGVLWIRQIVNIDI
jgi:tight adherence protein B